MTEIIGNILVAVFFPIILLGIALWYFPSMATGGFVFGLLVRRYWSGWGWRVTLGGGAAAGLLIGYGEVLWRDKADWSGFLLVTGAVFAAGTAAIARTPGLLAIGLEYLRG